MWAGTEFTTARRTQCVDDIVAAKARKTSNIGTQSHRNHILIHSLNTF